MTDDIKIGDKFQCPNCRNWYIKGDGTCDVTRKLRNEPAHASVGTSRAECHCSDKSTTPPGRDEMQWALDGKGQYSFPL